MFRRLLALTVVVAACGHAEPPQSPSTPPPSPTVAPSPPPSATAVPDHDGCTTDADCVIAAERDPQGCCIADPKPRPMSRAFVDWREARRATACPAPCMPPPVPVALSACESTARCVAGRCADICP